MNHDNNHYNRKDDDSMDDLCKLPLNSKMMQVFGGLDAGFYFDLENLEVFLSKKYVANLDPKRRYVVETLFDTLNAEQFDD